MPPASATMAPPMTSAQLRMVSTTPIRIRVGNGSSTLNSAKMRVHAGPDEGRQLAGEEDDVGLGDVEKAGEVVRHRLLGRRRMDFDDLEPLQPERLLGGGGPGGIDPAIAPLTGLGVGPVGVTRHPCPRSDAPSASPRRSWSAPHRFWSTRPTGVWSCPR